jgi:hypothetical protein
MPLVDFEGWTGATAYTLIAVVFAGAAVVLVTAGEEVTIECHKSVIVLCSKRG